MDKILPLDDDYKHWLHDLKSRIRQSQIKASVRVNSAMLELYWGIGADIVARQAESVWGSGVLRQLSRDIQEAFPSAKGFSVTNLKYMKMFYLFYARDTVFLPQIDAGFTEGQSSYEPLPLRHQLGDQTSEDSKLLDSPASIGHQVGDQLPFPVVLGAVPWRHHIEIVSRCKSVEEALFYIRETVENGWSRAMLLNFLDTDLYKRKGKATNNFAALLPKPQSDLAREVLKDPYCFDFVSLMEDYREKELEDALTFNMTKFLIELGRGFAYVGRQVPILVGKRELFIDLLFYHLELRCYVVIELKAGELEAEHAGKLGIYVSAVNHQFRKETDNPTIGLIICKTKDKVMAEYAVEASSQPIGISEYELSRLLPENYKSALPSIDEIEAELEAKQPSKM